MADISDAAARIKKAKKTQHIKFKVRCQKHLYTLVLKDQDKAEKLKASLPPSTWTPPEFFVAIAAGTRERPADVERLWQTSLSRISTPRRRSRNEL